jgi:hypothetical protein
VVREGVGAGGRNDPSLVCTYELKKNHIMKKKYLSRLKKKKKEMVSLAFSCLCVNLLFPYGEN